MLARGFMPDMRLTINNDTTIDTAKANMENSTAFVTDTARGAVRVVRSLDRPPGRFACTLTEPMAPTTATQAANPTIHPQTVFRMTSAITARLTSLRVQPTAC